MAVSTYHSPARAGSTLSTLAATLTSGITSFFDSLARALVVNSTAQERLNRVERLNQLTDAQLASRGLKREDIVHHVFRDMFWN